MKLLLNRLYFLVSALVFCAGVTHAQVTVPPGGSIDVPNGGNMNLGCNALIVQGNFNVNAGQVTGAGGVNIGTGGTFDAGAGSIVVSGNWSNSGSFVPGTGTVTFTDGCSTGNIVISGQSSFTNLTLTSTSGRTFVVPAGSNITVTGTLTLQGTSGQPISLVSSSGQTAIINLGPTATVVNTNTNINNVQIGSPVPASIPTLSEYGLMALAMLMLLLAYRQRKRIAFDTARK